MAGAAGVLVLSGDDGEGEGAPAGRTTVEPSSAGGDEAAPARKDPEEGNEGNGEERRVRRTVRRYLAAINDRDGRELCELVPSLTEDLELPEERDGCAASVRASIGYADPRGSPVFQSAKPRGRPEIEVDGAEARATATVITQFADRSEPSVEDDVVYLERRGQRWLIAKPSSTLYRAIGVPDVPPGVLRKP